MAEKKLPSYEQSYTAAVAKKWEAKGGTKEEAKAKYIAAAKAWNVKKYDTESPSAKAAESGITRKALAERKASGIYKESKELKSSEIPSKGAGVTKTETKYTGPMARQESSTKTPTFGFTSGSYKGTQSTIESAQDPKSDLISGKGRGGASGGIHDPSFYGKLGPGSSIATDIKSNLSSYTSSKVENPTSREKKVKEEKTTTGKAKRQFGKQQRLAEKATKIEGKIEKLSKSRGFGGRLGQLKSSLKSVKGKQEKLRTKTPANTGSRPAF